jgi:hypothetical protein
MKNKRGRPRGKQYPNPFNTSEGIDNAVYGKIATTEGWTFVRDCPYNTVEWIKRKEPKNLGRAEREFLKRAPKMLKRWAMRVGPLLGKKITSGDNKFFCDVAKASRGIFQRSTLD